MWHRAPPALKSRKHLICKGRAGLGGCPTPRDAPHRWDASPRRRTAVPTAVPSPSRGAATPIPRALPPKPGRGRCGAGTPPGPGGLRVPRGAPSARPPSAGPCGGPGPGEPGGVGGPLSVRALTHRQLGERRVADVLPEHLLLELQQLHHQARQRLVGGGLGLDVLREGAQPRARSVRGGAARPGGAGRSVPSCSSCRAKGARCRTG